MQSTVVSDSPGVQVPLWHWKSVRIGISIILFSVMLLMNAQRNVLSMAVVCMINGTALNNESAHTNLSSATPNNSINNGCAVPHNGETQYEGSLVWTSTELGNIFSALYWGSLVSTFPSGWISDKYGAKYLVAIGMLLTISGCLLTPITAVHGGVIALFAVRFIMGIGVGVSFPAAPAIISRWFPPNERSTAIAIYTSGAQFSMLIMPLAAWLCTRKDLLGGWPMIFYIVGAGGAVILIAWLLFLTNSPDENSRISDIEKNYILTQLEAQDGCSVAQTLSIPWLTMLKSPAFLTLIVSDVATGMMASITASYIPTYFKDVLFFDLSQNGLFTAVPFIAMWLSKMVMSSIADNLKKRTNLSHQWICKTFNSIGTFGTALAIVGLGFITCKEPGWAVFLLALSQSLFSGIIPGYLTAAVTIAPRYAGVINSFCTMGAHLGGLASPYIVGAITIHGHASEWRIVFLIIGGCFSAAGTSFLIFGTTHAQSWDKETTISDCPSQSDSETTEHNQNLESDREFQNPKDGKNA